MDDARREVVVVEAVRTPIGRRNGGLADVHPADLLGAVQREVIDRSGIDPEVVGQVVGGCVSQVGEQSFNVTRTAWLGAGLPLSVAATTVDTQCGSSQQATNVATSLVGFGVVDVALACGVESMTRIPMGSNFKPGPGRPITSDYLDRYEFTSQFEGAERIAEKWAITRDDADAFALRSQERAARALREGRFGTQIVGVAGLTQDEGPRETTLEGLAKLKPVAREDGVHTAGSSSQISDGAAAVILAERRRAEELGLPARARIVDTCLVGVDPVLMLTGPIDATQHLLARNGLGIDDIDIVEINEAFASVVIAWERELHPNPDIVNPNGGAIALGHPLGGTGAILTTKAVHELERTGGRYALVTMCCGGGLGTGTLIERL